MNKITFYVMLLVCFFYTAFPVHADYVFPYPSYMPGNKLYKLSRFIDAANAYWHWGNIAKVTYHLRLTDKYLIEAKTLIEYKQYLLGFDALSRANEHMAAMDTYITQAKNKQIDTSQITHTVRESALASMDIISQLKNITPNEFLWTPEKQKPTMLNFSMLYDESVRLRENIVKKYMKRL